MPVADTAPRMATLSRRELRSSADSFCTNGSTNTELPMTIFWPDRSVETTPVSGLVTGWPLRPVMMKASLGPATLMRVTTARTARTTSASAAPRAIRTVDMAVPLCRSGADGAGRGGTRSSRGRRPAASADGERVRVAQGSGATSTLVSDSTSST